MKAVRIGGCSLGVLLCTALWLAGQARLLGLDLDSAPVGRHLGLEQDTTSLALIYGEAWEPGRPDRLSMRAERTTLVLSRLPSFFFGPFPGGWSDGTDGPRKWLLVRCPNWYLILLLGAGVLAPAVRARLIHPRAEVSAVPPEAGRRVVLCDAAVLLGLVLVTVALFWLGSVPRDETTSWHGAVPQAFLSGGLTFLVFGWVGYAIIGRTRPRGG